MEAKIAVVSYQGANRLYLFELVIFRAIGCDSSVQIWLITAKSEIGPFLEMIR